MRVLGYFRGHPLTIRAYLAENFPNRSVLLRTFKARPGHTQPVPIQEVTVMTTARSVF